MHAKFPFWRYHNNVTEAVSLLKSLFCTPQNYVEHQKLIQKSFTHSSHGEEFHVGIEEAVHKRYTMLSWTCHRRYLTMDCCNQQNFGSF